MHLDPYLVLIVGALDTMNAIIQSMRYSVFTLALGGELGDRHDVRAGVAGEQRSDRGSAAQTRDERHAPSVT
jgi:hypothetical protein